MSGDTSFGKFNGTEKVNGAVGVSRFLRVNVSVMPSVARALKETISLE